MAESKDDYNPYEHREVVHPISNFGALTNVIKAIIGTGILVAPMAFHNAGWLNALISTTLIGIIVLYSKQMLLYGMYEIAKRRRVPLLTYAEGVVEAVVEGPPCMRRLHGVLRCMVNSLLFIYHFGSCCVYVVFIANCIKDLGDHYWSVWDSRIYMCCEILPLCLIYCVPNLKSLVPFAMVANFSLSIGFGIIFYYMFTNLQPFEDLKAMQDLRLYPLFIGSTLFAFEAPGLVVSIEANMKKPQSYVGLTGVLSVGIFFVVLLQLVFGLFGYWRYGEAIKSAILQSLPYDEILSNTARVIFAFSMYISHPLQGYVPIDVMWNNWLKAKVPESKAFVLELLFRLCLAILSVLLAVAWPNLTLILSFVGAFCLSFLGLIFPAIIDISIRYEKGYGPLKIYLLLSVIVILFGVVGGITGSYVPIEQMIKLYLNGTNLTG
ncbi:proton-coupled amino acid transporter-like protein CG1139 [Ceratitis capitata]|uniref:proton-coupled amino acid transporter-like protein CG1139 n=1 Tax=Ceratitis capitata TaxID=7213 RepID=UPI000618808B|nr:proton-coupled amino acid transporter-like protein CG1139 [Ceratitis capitata]